MARPVRQILFVISSDPRSSPRPAEAVRIAAGINAWQQAAVRLYLAGPAVFALDDEIRLLDEEHLREHLPALAAGQQVYVEEDSTFLPRIRARIAEVPAISGSEVARLAADSFALLRF